MPYASADDMAQRYETEQLAQLTGAVDGVPVAEKLATALADASAEIDSYLVARYALPIASPPAILVRLCCDITIYRLFEVAREDEIKDVRQRYLDAIAWLKDARDGKNTVEAPPASGGSGASASGAAVATKQALFNSSAWG